MPKKRKLFRNDIVSLSKQIKTYIDIFRLNKYINTLFLKLNYILYRYI